jgi:hypothetical protein
MEGDNAGGLPVRGRAFRATARKDVPHELSVLALLKGKERFLYVYDDESRERLIDAIRDQAADPNVSLSWFDAAVLTQRARQQGQEACAGDDSHERD